MPCTKCMETVLLCGRTQFFLKRIVTQNVWSRIKLENFENIACCAIVSK